MLMQFILHPAATLEQLQMFVLTLFLMPCATWISMCFARDKLLRHKIIYQLQIMSEHNNERRKYTERNKRII